MLEVERYYPDWYWKRHKTGYISVSSPHSL